VTVPRPRVLSDTRMLEIKVSLLKELGVDDHAEGAS
jgi:hypothetical protein